MANERQLRVAIIGCGVIASDHLAAIKANCGPVELYFCDQNPDAAHRLKDKIGVDAQVYTNARNLLSRELFDVVHVLTPPDSHYEIATMALENGANVLVEKPMTLALEEAQKLYLLAERVNKTICVNHSILHMDCVLKAFDLISSGKLGRVIAVHCFFGHDEKKKTIPYGGVSHWTYNLPGGPLLNLISHPASMLVELLGRPESITFLADARNFMPFGFSDFVDVSIRTSKGHGSFTLSMAHGNASRYANIECEKGSIYVDLARQLTIVRFHKGRLGFISKALSGIAQGFSFINGTLAMIYKVAAKKMKSNPGTHKLVTRFYQTVRNNAPWPVSKENAIGVAEIYEYVFKKAGR